MKKTIIQGLAIMVLFATCLYFMNKVNWMKLFHIEQFTKSADEKMNKLFIKVFIQDHEEVKDLEVINPVDSILTRICETNNIKRNDIQLHIIQSDDVNAFALPGGHLIVFTGLIDFVENESELAGVMGHEIAHIQLNHVIKKMGKEAGLSVLIEMTSGGGSGEMVKQVLKTLTSTAFDRELEKDADIKSVEYLSNASIDYKGMSAFMNRLSKEKDNLGDHITILSTHPASHERATYILEQGKMRKYEIKPVLSDSIWKNFKTKTQNLHN